MLYDDLFSRMEALLGGIILRLVLFMCLKVWRMMDLVVQCKHYNIFTDLLLIALYR